MTPGTLVAGRYRIVRMRGRGGMGAVYEAVDQQTDRRRAIKLMLDHRVQDTDARDRFEREARMAGRINSPYIVDVIDAGIDPDSDTPYIVMELLEGENLDERVARLGRRPAAEVVDHLGQLARALRQMHAKDVVHRDLKPSNLFVDVRDGAPRIRVLDLGIAKVLSATAHHTTGIVGSVPYMAPEQIRGRPVSPATDLYALGLIAFTLLTGSLYWRVAGDDEPIALAMRISEGLEGPASRRARELGVELPPAFDAWFARILSRQPSQRFGSALEAIRALAGALDVEPPWPWDEPEVEPPWLPVPVDGGDTQSLASANRATETGWPSEAPRRAGEASTELARPASRRDRPPVPRPSARLTRRRIAVLLAVALTGGSVAAWRSTAPSSPLQDPSSVIACPILAVEGDVSHWGWLGAAAGSLACERARVLLGGVASRTRIPAELLELRGRLALDDDPYGASDARDRSLAAGRRASAYVDGKISRLGSDELSPSFRVDLVLRRPDGGELRRASGEARALYEAVRAAMNGLVDADAIPRASHSDPVVADYSRAQDSATLLHLLDVKLAATNNTGDDLIAECTWFASDEARATTDLAPLIRSLCSYNFGDMPRDRVVLPSAATPGARTARARAAHLAFRQDDPQAIADLEQLYTTEPQWARSVIASTLSCLLQSSAPDEALRWAQNAVRDEPKNPTGEWCGPLGQLMAVADNTSFKDEATTTWRVWAPWESYAWWFAARNTERPERSLIYAKRAYVLSPLDTNVADALATQLLGQGQTASVGRIAARFAGSTHPAFQIFNSLLTIRYLASETRFDKAVSSGRDAMASQLRGAGWTRAQRLEIAWRTVEIASVLGSASEVADRAIDALVMPEPTLLDFASPDTAPRITAICAHASKPAAEGCFARLRALKAPLDPAFAEGARRFAAGDLSGAATAWQPVLRSATDLVKLLADPMIQSLAAVHDYDQAIEIERRTEDTANQLGGANMAMARTAQAMAASGDRAGAARLARQVLDAWRNADRRPPILDDMTRIVR